MDRRIRVTVGKSRLDKRPKGIEIPWRTLVSNLTKFRETAESFADYCSAGNAKLDMKDVGWFVGGHFTDNVRRRDNLLFRSVLCLDADHLEPGDDVLSPYAAFEHVWHTSHSHSSDAPRYRLVFPLARDVKPEEYEPLARAVASMAGMDYFDDTGYQVSRIMFWPSHSRDGEHECAHVEGEWLDPDFVLDLNYSDPNDFGEWPQSSREKAAGGARGTMRKAEPPWDKPGVIGAFNRVFDIPEAIEFFELPYTLSGMGEGRYSYAEGTSIDGAIYYPDTGHLYSWHESDPARGNSNAWDLVRIHKFGMHDTEKDQAIGERPSQKMMTKFAHSVKAVTDELAGREFDFDPAEIKTEVERELEAARKTRRQSYQELLDRIEDDCPAEGQETTDFLAEIAAANLNPSLEGHLLKRIKAHNDSTLGDMRAELKHVKRGLSAAEDQDQQRALMEHMLREHYADGDHIRRFAGAYWIFDNGVWRVEEDERVAGRLQSVIMGLREKRPEDYRDLVAVVGEKETSALVNALHKSLAYYLAERETSPDPLGLCNPPPMAMNCLNGTVWFNEDGTHEFREHDPLDFFTNQLDVIYDPEAECPEWDRLCGFMFDDSILPDEMQRHLEEFCGYLLQMSRPIKTIAFFLGKSNAGKSTVAKVLTTMLNRAAFNAPLESFEGNSHATADLQGKLLVIDDDMSKKAVLDDGFLKRISEAKIMTVNPKYRDSFTLLSLALPMVISNSMPRVSSQDEALANRMLVFPFTTPIPREKQDPRRADALLAQRSGVLNRFIAGFCRVVKRGNRWDLPLECAEAAQQWRVEANPVLRWVRETLEDTGDKKDVMRQGDLYPMYTNWMQHEGLSRFTKGRNHFLEDLRDVIRADRLSKLDGYNVLRGYKTREGAIDDDF